MSDTQRLRSFCRSPQRSAKASAAFGLQKLSPKTRAELRRLSVRELIALAALVTSEATRRAVAS